MRVVPQRGEVRILRHDCAAQLLVDGVSVHSELAVERSALRPGVVLQLGPQVTILLHDRPPAGVPLGGELGMVGVSASMGQLRDQLRRAAAHDVSVLLQGESGTGKELAAKALHDLSRRRNMRFVAVNMAAIPVSMMAAQLFGHTRGAFTGASTEHAGYFAQADQGTLFLDEMGEVGPEVQAGLLRALETKELQRVGDERTRKVDVRIIAASDRNLMAEVVAGRLRNPLFHRLAGYWIVLPPLRDRLEDLPLLLRHYLQQTGAVAEDPVQRRDQPLLPPALWPVLLRHSWPGNIRELINVARSLAIDGLDRPPADIVRAARALLAQTQAVAPSVRPPLAPDRPARPISGPIEPVEPPEVLDGTEVMQVLRQCKWVVKEAAQRIGCSRQSIYRLIRSGALGLELLDDIPSERIAAAMAHATSLEDLAVRVLRVSSEQLRRRISAEAELQRAFRAMQRGPADH